MIPLPKPDRYQWYARILPSIIVLIPIGLSLISLLYAKFHQALFSHEKKEAIEWFSDTSFAVIGFSFILYILIHWGRNNGKKCEEQLFLEWGGKPTTAHLRHSDLRISSHTKARYHDFFRRSVPINIPTSTEERNNPASADSVYEACIHWILPRTRDTKKFNLLFQENISYGFRRNLWGLKTTALAICALVISAELLLAMWLPKMTYQPYFIIAATGLIAWIWSEYINKSWIKIAADAYAIRLLECTEIL